MYLDETILIFDSGVGGLSIYSEVYKKNPNLRYLYVFDNAAFPYGNKEDNFIIARVVAIVEKLTKSYSFSIMVIACNTASTIVLPTLRKRFPNIHFVGVVPAIKGAVSITRNGVVGLLATHATISREYTHELIERFSKESRVELLAVPELVLLAEMKLRGRKWNNDVLEALFKPWKELDIMPDTIVLGCTHFPLLIDEIQNLFPEETVLVDSGEAIARRVEFLLNENKEKWHIKCHKLEDGDRENVAIYTQMDESVEELKQILKNYHFSKFSLC